MIPFDLSKILVISGSYQIRKSESAILEAFLGTCVGVAVYDKENSIGGLYHILLPEPSFGTEAWEPLNYAKTGMPSFLNALYDAGAKRDTMKAVIAGGALVGSISQEDLNLDIGGRTADIVIDILKQENINIEKTEIGGYFNCNLMLNLDEMKCSVQSVGEKPPPPQFKSPPLKSEVINDAINKTRPIPQIALKIIRMINTEDYEMREIADEVKQDQVISAKVITLSNSAMFSPRRKIESIGQALVMLGEKRLLQMVISASVELYFQDAASGYSLCKGGLYHHAVGTAETARKISQLLKIGSSDVAYTGGLLHDIGKVVLDQFVAEKFPMFYRELYESGERLVKIEKQVIGTSHVDVGKRLAELWDLPESLTEVIAHHHDPEKAKINPELTHVVYFADLLMSRFKTGDTVGRMNTDNFTQRLRVIGLTKSNFIKMIEIIPWNAVDFNLNA